MCRPRHVLVEDDPSIRELLRLHLSIAGYKVDEIDNGKEALARAVTSRYDHCLPARLSRRPPDRRLATNHRANAFERTTIVIVWRQPPPGADLPDR